MIYLAKKKTRFNKLKIKKNMGMEDYSMEETKGLLQV
jgi:hypothetical protein